MKGALDTVIFDVGRVLFDFSMDGLFDFFSRAGLEVKGTADFLEKTDELSYEKGELSTEQFLSNVEGILGGKVDRELIIRRWVCIFKPVRGMLSLLSHLRARYRVLLLSNTNELHWQFLLDRYHLGSRVDGYLTSFEARSAKPEPEIYGRMIDEFSLKVDECLFIDDLEENVQAAEALGIAGIHHINEEETRCHLRKLGVEC